MNSKIIKIDRFKDYRLNLFHYSHFLPSNINFLQAKTIFILTLAGLAFVSLINLQAVKLFIPLLIIYFYQWHEAQAIRKHLIVKRDHPVKGKEEEEIDTTYQFSNPTPFDFSNFNLFDHFNGHSNESRQNFFILTSHLLPKRTRKQYRRRLALNEGMGEKIFGPIGLSLTDELGIHRLIYKDQTQTLLQVYPKIYPSKPHHLSADPYSSHFGDFDTFNRGENVNFFGVREYQQGDNVKKINWKLSLKNHQIVVNEFEKNVNAKLLIVFNNDNRIHSGMGAQSSFEYIKDFTLTLCHHHTKNFNEICLISHSAFTKYNSGPSHIRGIEFLISKLKLENFNLTEHYHRGAKKPSEIISLQKKVMMEIDGHTHIYFLSGFMPGKISHFYIEALRLWARKAKSTTFIAVSNLEQNVREADEQMRATGQSILKTSTAQKKQIQADLKKYSINLKFVEVDRNIPYLTTIQNGLNLKRNNENPL